MRGLGKFIVVAAAMLCCFGAMGQTLKWTYNFDITGDLSILVDLVPDGHGGCAILWAEDAVDSLLHLVWINRKGKVLLDKIYGEEFSIGALDHHNLISVGRKALIVQEQHAFNIDVAAYDRNGTRTLLEEDTFLPLENREDYFVLPQHFRDPRGFFVILKDVENNATGVKYYRNP